MYKLSSWSCLDKAEDTIHSLQMSKANLLFHIAKRDGLEFVFNSGNALSYPMHSHISVYTITVVLRGMVKLIRKNSTDIYASGSVYVVSPYEVHSPYYVDCFNIISLCVDKNNFSEKKCSVIATCLKYSQMLMDKNLLSADTVSRLMIGIELIYAYNENTDMNPTIKPILLDLFDSNYNDGINNFLQISRFHFIRKFKYATRLTPHQYIIQNRMREVKKLLTTNQSIADAAALAGFCDQSHLNRWFNRNIGITPYDYKKSCFFF